MPVFKFSQKLSSRFICLFPFHFFFKNTPCGSGYNRPSRKHTMLKTALSCCYSVKKKMNSTHAWRHTAITWHSKQVLGLPQLSLTNSQIKYPVILDWIVVSLQTQKKRCFSPSENIVFYSGNPVWRCHSFLMVK